MTPPTGNGSCSPASGICIIMAGGRGTRFWPLSRKDRPKQLLALASGRSLLRETFDRLVPLVGPERVLVITSGSLAEPTRAELPELDAAQVVNEPVGRNTAPCAALGMALAARIDPEAPVALLPADHFIPDDGVFRDQLATAFAVAAANPTVLTFGIPPTRPETGYGYLLTDAEEGTEIRRGLAFVEKPDLATAERYVRGGRHLWNSGIFVWNPRHFAAVAGREMDDIVQAMAPAAAEFGTDRFEAALQSAYAVCRSESIDNAVMEKLDDFGVLAAGYRWSDLGSWDAWGELAEGLPAENRGRGELLPLDAHGNILMVPDKLTALIGVEDLIVVDAPDALLICRKDQAQRLKEVIERLEASERGDLL